MDNQTQLLESEADKLEAKIGGLEIKMDKQSMLLVLCGVWSLEYL